MLHPVFLHCIIWSIGGNWKVIKIRKGLFAWVQRHAILPRMKLMRSFRIQYSSWLQFLQVINQQILEMILEPANLWYLWLICFWPPQLCQGMASSWDENLRWTSNYRQATEVWNDFRRQMYFCDGNLADPEHFFSRLFVKQG